MRVVGADIDAPPPAEFLEPHPDVGLQILDQVSDVDMAVGVGQGAGNEDLPHDCWLLRMKGKHDRAEKGHYSETAYKSGGRLGRNLRGGTCRTESPQRVK